MDVNVTPKIQLIPHAALAYMASKKLKTSYHWYEVYAQEHNHVFTVAKIMEMDVLNEIHKGILQAIEKGETFEHFKKNMLNRLGEKGWGKFSQADEKTGETITRLSDSRLKKIYFVNKTQARQKGNWARFEESKETFPYLRYRLGASRQHREAHLRFKDLVLRVDDPFWDTHMPMNGWGCKCWVQQLTEEQAQEQGIDESPKIEYHDWINPATGEIHKVPKGISPGFEYNVGKSQSQMDKELLRGSKERHEKIKTQTNQLMERQKIYNGLKEKMQGIDYHAVSPLERQLNSEEIIQKISGGDKTEGSCASLTICYIANKLGLDVLDFRGGKSQEVFSRGGARELLTILNVKSIIEEDMDAEKIVVKVLKHVVEGKEYVLSLGQHMAIIRKNNGVIQYLELQDNEAENNTFVSVRYAKEILKRFGRPKISKKYKLAGRARLWNLEDVSSNSEFKEILGYINTKVSEQNKGADGHVR